MLATVFGFLKNLKLSLMEWLVLSGAAAIGALVVALKIQGSRLHRAQLDLLEKTRGDEEAKAQEAVDATDSYYQKVRQAYLDAGGKL